MSTTPQPVDPSVLFGTCTFVIKKRNRECSFPAVSHSLRLCNYHATLEQLEEAEPGQWTICPGCQTNIKLSSLAWHTPRCHGNEGLQLKSQPWYKKGMHLRNQNDAKDAAKVERIARITSVAYRDVNHLERTLLLESEPADKPVQDRPGKEPDAKQASVMKSIEELRKRLPSIHEPSIRGVTSNSEYDDPALDVKRLQAFPASRVQKALVEMKLIGHKRLRHAVQEMLLAADFCTFLGIDSFQSTVLCEPGAGKGNLSQCMSLHYGADHIVQLDLENFRDRRESGVKAACRHFERLKIDICDFDFMSYCDHLKEESMRKLPRIVVGKHVCGAATDFAMHLGKDADALMLATCCRGKCVFDEFSNPQMLERLLDIRTEEQFQGLISLACHANGYLSRRPFDPASDMYDGYRLPEKMYFGDEVALRETLDGRMARDMLDVARAETLRSWGFDKVVVQHYCSTSWSPESVVLMAMRTSSFHKQQPSQTD